MAQLQSGEIKLATGGSLQYCSRLKDFVSESAAVLPIQHIQKEKAAELLFSLLPSSFLQSVSFCTAMCTLFDMFCVCYCVMYFAQDVTVNAKFSSGITFMGKQCHEN